ncbi:thioredoxin [Alteromonas aestuariivivens]|uniref:Thioredoxin n=1 Tax=Alteromonas aestuariivivens TaxID=1938339 RepID=A0A3D8M7H6_9ALTE|nr:DUF6436 domain-containing protein [Alteromonas aestuariivivens]RDV25504.1 thioredoxin [Alteromonas aestuariivivens]
MKHPAAGWLMLLAWAGSILAGLWFYSFNQLQEFDPLHKLATAASLPNFDAGLAQQLNVMGIAPGSLVHITTQDQCYCSTLADDHLAELSQTLQSNGYQAVRLNLQASPQLQKLFSSVPALIVFGSDAQIRYVGPYSSGFGCFSGKNLLDTIARLARQPDFYGAVVNSEANGCFCRS